MVKQDTAARLSQRLAELQADIEYKNQTMDEATRRGGIVSGELQGLVDLENEIKAVRKALTAEEQKQVVQNKIHSPLADLSQKEVGAGRRRAE